MPVWWPLVPEPAVRVHTPCDGRPRHGPVYALTANSCPRDQRVTYSRPRACAAELLVSGPGLRWSRTHESTDCPGGRFALRQPIIRSAARALRLVSLGAWQGRWIGWPSSGQTTSCCRWPTQPKKRRAGSSEAPCRPKFSVRECRATGKLCEARLFLDRTGRTNIPAPQTCSPSSRAGTAVCGQKRGTGKCGAQRDGQVMVEPHLPKSPSERRARREGKTRLRIFNASPARSHSPALKPIPTAQTQSRSGSPSTKPRARRSRRATCQESDELSWPFAQLHKRRTSAPHRKPSFLLPTGYRDGSVRLIRRAGQLLKSCSLLV